MLELQLKKLRKYAGFKTQSEFAAQLGVPSRRYESWERQEAMMSLEQAYNVTEALGCTLDELVGRKPIRSYANPKQAILNGYFESMNSAGQDALVESARLMSGSPDTRIEKDREEPLSIHTAMAG